MIAANRQRAAAAAGASVAPLYPADPFPHVIQGVLVAQPAAGQAAGSSSGAPLTLFEMAEVLKTQLQLEDNIQQIVNQAAEMLGVPQKGNTMDLARACLEQVQGSSA